VFGNLVMAQPPISANQGQSVSFPWRAFAVVPSSNSLAEFSLDLVAPGALTGNSGVSCWR
jgi:hypothetical protein